MKKFNEIRKQLKNRNPLPPLKVEKIWDENLSKEIQQLTDEEVTGLDNPSSLAAKATRAGLLLWNDDMYASHDVSNSIPEQVGSYWHGIMHRQEADYGNSKFWFSKVGDHEVFNGLYTDASNILPEIKEWGAWDPNRFIDLVEEEVTKHGENTERAEKLRQIQQLEFSLLLEYSRSL